MRLTAVAVVTLAPAVAWSSNLESMGRASDLGKILAAESACAQPLLPV